MMSRIASPSEWVNSTSSTLKEEQNWEGHKIGEIEEEQNEKERNYFNNKMYFYLRKKKEQNKMHESQLAG